MKQELVLGLLRHGLILQDPPHVCQKQHGHIEGIVPKLLEIDGIRSDMLEAALLRPWEALHDPAGSLDTGLHVFFLPGVFRQEGHGQVGRGGVHVQGWKSDLDLPVIIFFQRFQVTEKIL